MHRSQRLIFGNIEMPRDEKVPTPSEDPEYLKNTLILEMSNNWPHVRWLMDRFRNKEIKTIDPLERDWLNFILNNNIDVEKYGKDSDKFLEEWFKIKE